MVLINSILSSKMRRLPFNLTTRLCSTAAIKTSHHETPRIPTLPVQPLEQMCDKYLKSVKPFVSNEEFENTKKLMQMFCNDENKGKKLQKLLEERAKSMENWLSDWWLNTAYLEYRKPVVVYSSPGLVWPKVFFHTKRSQLIYAANLIHAVLKFNQLIEERKIQQEQMGKNPMCMNQYYRIFGTCRIPDAPRDRLIFQDEQNPSRNIIVIYNNHFFSIPVFEEHTRDPLGSKTFLAVLEKIVGEWSETPGPPVGVLTTENRDNWANTYKKLKEDPRNTNVLEDHIEKSLFVVCIDKPLSLGSGHDYDTRCSKLLLHGFGMRGNAGNRWYDKTLQFVVGAENNGVGITYEHSPAEGGPIGVLTDYVIDKMKTEENFKERYDINVPDFVKLEFHLSDSVKQDIESAGKAVDRINNDLDVLAWSFTHYGKSELKNIGVSPDSFIQIAIQCAFYKIHKHPGAQYESGSLRQYMYGRTDTIRSCSEEVVEFCKMLWSNEFLLEEKKNALMNALKAHKNYALDVINGRGIDRHLLGLRILAKDNNIDLANLFTDVAYQRSAYFQLSTSNVPAANNTVMVYGPLVDDGYACCYNPRSRSINFGMSAWSSCRETRLSSFENALLMSLTKMHECITYKTSKL